MRTERNSVILVAGGLVPSRLVGKAKHAAPRAQSRPAWALGLGLLAALSTSLAGCGAIGVPANAGVPETRVTFKKAATSAKAAPTAAPAARSAATAVRRPAAAPGASSAPEQAGAAGSGDEAARAVAIVAAPAAGVRMFPMMAGDVLADARFAPADGTLAWTLRAPRGGVRLAKVKVVVEGGAAPVTSEGPPANYELPAELAGEAEVRATFALVDTMAALAGAPGARELRATYTFTGPDGRPVVGADGAPLALTARIDVQ